MADLNGDGIDDNLQRASQAMISAAIHIGRAIAIARETALRRAAERTREVQLALEKRLSVERTLAHVALRGTAQMTNEELDRLPVRDLAKRLELAAAWREVDVNAHEAYPVLRQHVQERFGFDPERTLGATEKAIDLSIQAVRDFAAAEQAEAVAEESEAAKLDHETRAEAAELRVMDLRRVAASNREGIDPDKALAEYTAADHARLANAEMWSGRADEIEREGRAERFMVRAAENRVLAARMDADRLQKAGLSAEQVRGVLAGDRAFPTSPTTAVTAQRGIPAKQPAAELARVRKQELAPGR